MRLIDADALFENLDGMMAVSPTGYIHGDTVADMINDAPIVDAVPVIRCKDCKHYKWEIDMCNLEGATVFPMNVVHEDDYCSRAERKDKNDSCQSV